MSKSAASRIGMSEREYLENIEKGLKRCASCKQWQPRAAFGRDKSRSNGLHAQCRTCHHPKPESSFHPIPGEVWRAVHGYEGFYEVSDLGRVRRVIDLPRRSKPPRLLKQTPSHGYRAVALIRDGEERHVGTHILVAEAFICPAPDGMEVNHIDGVKSNNLPSNLEWLTRSGNIQHAYRTGLAVALNGENHPKAKLTVADVLRIRELRGKVSQSRLAVEYGVSKTAIRKAQKGDNWKCIRQFPTPRPAA